MSRPHPWSKVEDTVVGLFDDRVPDDFLYNGETFHERVAYWLQHAFDRLDKELTEFKEDRAAGIAEFLD